MAYKAGTCSVEGCGPTGRLHKGLCVGHYQRFKTHGDPLIGPSNLIVSGKRKRTVSIKGDVAEVPLTSGYVAIVDVADAGAVAAHNWHARVDENTVYAWTSIVDEMGNRRGVSLHSFLCDSTDLVDHKDGDGLNNRRSNLRPATHHQNQCNKRLSKNNLSGYKGVRFAAWVSGQNKWRAQIMVNGRRKSLGYHATPEDAAHSYDASAIELFGEFARLNFPVGGAA